MIDTLMAFWNQNRRKRAAQLLLTFLLMCISISLLFVAISLPHWSRTYQQGLTGSGATVTTVDTGGSWNSTPTVVVHITMEPQTTPTGTIVVPSQETPIAANGGSACSSPTTQANVAATAPTSSVVQLAGTPSPTSTMRKIPATPSTPVSQKSTTPTPEISVTPSPTTTATTPPTVGSTATPVEPTPSAIATPGLTATVSATPTTTATQPPTPSPGIPHVPGQQQSGGAPGGSGSPASPVPTGGTQSVGGGWLPACGGNDIGLVAGAELVTFLWHNAWNIVILSLVCTILFYSGLLRLMRKR